MGLGAAAAAIFMAGFAGQTPGSRLVLGSSLLFGLVVTAAGLAPEFWSAIVLFTLGGCTMALNGIAANTALQTQVPDHLRGRVMGFYSFVVLGMTPFGSFQAGWVSEHFGVRVAIALGGGICFLVAVLVGVERREKKTEKTERTEGGAERMEGEAEGTPRTTEGRSVSDTSSRA